MPKQMALLGVPTTRKLANEEEKEGVVSQLLHVSQPVERLRQRARPAVKGKVTEEWKMGQ